MRYTRDTPGIFMAGLFSIFTAGSLLKGYCDDNTMVVDIQAACVESAEPKAAHSEIAPSFYTEVQLEGYDGTFVFPCDTEIAQGDTVRNVHARCGPFSGKYRVQSFGP